MRNVGTTRLVVLGVVAALVATACGSARDDGGTSDELGRSNTIADVTLASGSFTPLERVGLVDVPDHLDVSNIVLWLMQDEGEISLPVYAGPEGAYVVTPSHPAGPLAGGTVEVQFELDGTRGPVLELEVGAIPESPGGWNAAVAAVRDAIDADAVALGTSFDELRATPFEDVPGELLPLKIAQVYLDDGTDNDLESAASGLSEEDLRALDAVVAAIRPESRLDAGGAPVELTEGEIEDVGPADVVPAESDEANAVDAEASAGASATSAMRTTARVRGGGGCRPSPISITNAAQLAAAMEKGLDNTVAPGGAEAQVLEDIGAITTWGGYTPGVGGYIGAVGALFTIIEGYLNATSGIYPTRFTGMRTTLSKASFAEDFKTPGTWSEIQVTAMSTGYTLDADLVKAILAGLSSHVSIRHQAGLAEEFAIDVVQHLRDNAVNDFIAENGGSLCWEPTSWTVALPSPYSTARAVLNLFEVDETARTFQPKETGLQLPVEDTLRIEINPDHFRGRTLRSDTPIKVSPIIVTGVGEVEVEDAGDPIELTVTVRNAEDPRVEWTTPFGSFVPGSDGEPGDGLTTTWTRTLNTPPQEDVYSFEVTIESTSTSGLRADGDPPRNHSITIRLASIIVSPNPGTVARGGTLQFVATDRRGEPIEGIRWSVTCGSIDDDGLFRAPNEATTCTVTAKKGDKEGTAQVFVAECPVGTWSMDLDSFETYMSNVLATTGAPTSFGFDLSGEYRLTFGVDGSLVAERIGLTISITGVDFASPITIDATETGSYVAGEDGSLVISGLSGSAVGQIEHATAEIGLPGTGGSGNYECDGDRLTITDPRWGSIVFTQVG